MNKLIASLAVFASGSALAHSGDHAGAQLFSALGHIFSSSDHLIAALVVLGGVAGVAVVAARHRKGAAKRAR